MKLLRAALRALLALALLVLGAGLLGSVAPVLDLANLVAVPFAAMGLAAALGLLLIVRRWWKKAGMGAAALACGFMLIPPAAPPSQCPAGTARLRVAWLNAQGSDTPGPIIDWLEREDPALVAFAELSRGGSQHVRAEVAERYPYMQSCLSRDACSTVIYARNPPLAMAGLARGNPQNRQALSAARMTAALEGEQSVNLMAAHLSRVFPLGRQGEELAELEGHIERPADTIILGDFNATRRMHVLRDFAARNGLGVGRADAPTWPLAFDGRATTPVIQIDQVLTGRNWAVEELRTSPDLGSDHRGLVADLCRLG